MRVYGCKQSGNVLFLILIAVALFAALSYAVTQSTRSGGGDTKRETSLISGAQITQYPASVKTAIIRMMISKGVRDEDLWFNIPSGGSGAYTGGISDITDSSLEDDIDNFVFYTDGGGATYQQAPDSVMDGGSGDWYFNALFAVEDIGTSDAEVIAFLTDLDESVCSSINDQFGIDDIPAISGVSLSDLEVNRGYTASGSVPNEGIGENGEDSIATASGTAGSGTTDADLAGEPFGCFETSDGAYVYYHVLVER